MNKKNRWEKINRITKGFSQVGMCLGCLKGKLVRRNSYRGMFWGCSRFPNCGYTQKMGEQQLQSAIKRIKNKVE